MLGRCKINHVDNVHHDNNNSNNTENNDDDDDDNDSSNDKSELQVCPSGIRCRLCILALMCNDCHKHKHIHTYKRH